MDIQFGNPERLSWFWLVALLAIVAIGALVHGRHVVKRFATANLQNRFFPASTFRRRWLHALAGVAALALLVPGLADIRWGKTWRQVPQRGIEVMFVLDVSRSMLASDAKPNRLRRAKQQIRDMVDEMAGDRVGLVVFAGNARQLVPLTSHVHDFKRTLDEVGPYNVELGGSRLGDAISLAAESFLSKTNNHKAIVIFTDGEDQESNPVQVAEQAYAEKGIRIFAVGLGDGEQGSRIPIDGGRSGRRYLEHNGQQVWSRLDGETLKQVAMVSHGAFVPAGTKQVDMADVYRRYVADVEQEDFETARIRAYIPRFQWFVGPALALMLMKIFWPAPRSANNTQPASNSAQQASRTLAHNRPVPLSTDHHDKEGIAA